jgi:hypothetical protein
MATLSNCDTDFLGRTLVQEYIVRLVSNHEFGSSFPACFTIGPSQFFRTVGMPYYRTSMAAVCGSPCHVAYAFCKLGLNV